MGLGRGLPAAMIPVVAVVIVWLAGWPLAAPAPAAVRAQAAAAVLVVETAIAVIAAPLAGVALGTRRDSRWTMAISLLTSVLLFCVTSLGVQRLVASSAAAETLAASHLTLATVTLALAALGALCGAWFADPLDAAAGAAGVALVAAFGVLLAGPLLDLLPSPLVAIALLANPIVATASAAHIDLFRTGALYQVSPIAHMQVDYPSASAACITYAALALMLFTGTGLQLDRRAGSTSLERMSA